MNWFRQIPFLRILIPFILGILLAFNIDGAIRLSPLLFLLLSLGLLLIYFVSRTYSFKYWLLAADLFLILFGFQLVQLNDPLFMERHYTKVYKPDQPIQLIGRLENVPAEKRKSIKVPLSLLEIRQNGQSCAVSGKLLVYVRKHRASRLLKAGQMLYLEGRLSEIEQNGNPGEFNYKHYLRNKQIFHILFVDSDAYRILPSKNNASIMSLALRCKQFTVDRLNQSGLSPEARSICAALLTGFDEEVGEDIVQSFSHSGTLHVLSVSGLHAGLIYAFLNVIFNFFDRYCRYKILRFVLIGLGMWGFAFVCGMEAPILRAVIMLTFLSIGDILFNSGRNSRLNILFLAAFVLLGVNPSLLKDIGFQLSFSAILGLIAAEPLWRDAMKNKPALTRWFWQSITASFTATLFTLPFTLYYFKQFPYWFFLANLIVVPAAFLLMLLAIGALLHWTWMVVVINVLTKALLVFIHLFDSDTYAYAKGLNFRLEDAFWLTLLMALLWPAIQRRSYRLLIYSLFTLFIWQLRANLQVIQDLNNRLVSIYRLREASAASVKEGARLYYRTDDAAAFKRVLEAHLSELGQPMAKPVKFNSVLWKNTRLLFLDSLNHIPEIDNKLPAILILSNNFELHEEMISYLGSPLKVVSDGSNSYSQNNKNEQLCRKFAVSYYALKKEGARLITSNEIKNW